MIIISFVAVALFVLFYFKGREYSERKEQWISELKSSGFLCGKKQLSNDERLGAWQFKNGPTKHLEQLN